MKSTDPKAVDKFIANLPQLQRDIRAAQFTRWVKQAVALNAGPKETHFSEKASSRQRKMSK